MDESTPSSGRNLLLCGYYGFGNTGDELILEALLTGVRGRRPDLRCTVVSGDPAATAARYGVGSVHWQDIVAIAAAVEAADLVVVGGGGLFQEYWQADPATILTERHGSMTFYAGPLLLAALLDRPAAVIGVGVGPVASDAGRRILRASCEAADLVSVRDEGSRDVLAAAGVPAERLVVGSDAVFGLAAAQATSRRPAAGASRGLVGVSVRPWGFGVDQERWEAEVAAALDELLAHEGTRIRFLPFQASSLAHEDDVAVSRRVMARLRVGGDRCLVESVAAGGDVLRSIAECDLVLGMRLHAVESSLMVGTPVVALAYDPKVAQVMERFGLGGFSLGLGGIRAAELAGLLREAPGRQLAMRSRLDATCRELRGLAGRDIDLALDLLGSARRRAGAFGPDLAALAGHALRAQLGMLATLRSEAAGRFEELQRAYDVAKEQGGVLARTSEELARTADELGRSREDLDRARKQADRVADELERSRAEAQRLGGQLQTAQNDLHAIHTSRLWRWGSRYWRMRELLLGERARGRRSVRKAGPPAPGAALPSGPRAAEGHADPRESMLAESEARHDVVCLPIIDWDFRWQRPQQLMSRYAAAGHRVFYVAQRLRRDGPLFTVVQKAQRVFEVSLRGPDLNVYRDTLDERACETLLAALDALRVEAGLDAAALVVQLPFWWPLAQQARERWAWPVVYDCMDLHAGFSTNRPEMTAQEDALLAGADVVVATSEPLEREALRHARRVVVVRNGCEYGRFSTVPAAPGGERPVIGYVGAIADWFDADLVADLAERRPEWRFELVGSTYSADVSRLSGLPNVRLTGEVPYADVPDWLARFDVGIIPFKRNGLTEATNPVKAYEMLAAGRPVVAVPIPEVAALAPHVRLADDAEGFERAIEASLAEEGGAEVTARREFARAHDWDRRFEAFSATVREAYPLASIVVVTYNNVELTRLCLDSIYRRTAWPNLEVFVVDNASADDTPSTLRQVAAERPSLVVIANDRNLGFAAANNQAIARVRGEFVVLLNNDTVVSRGWLSNLIRHLHADRRIGLLGAVTNEIGNEARIEVGYSEVAEMPAWAAAHVKARDGATRPLPMVAMFCVATRREVIDRVGFLDERFEVGMFEDDDYNRRVREAGYSIRCAEDVFVHHWQKSAFRLLGDKEYLRVFEQNRRRYEEKWGERWTGEGISVWQRADLGFFREQFEPVLDRVRGSRGAVVFLPSVGWAIQLAQRPHHLAREFARQGWVSVFDCSNAHDDVNGFREIEPGLFLFRGPSELLRDLSPSIVWTFPYNYEQAAEYPASCCRVYDVIDDLSIFPYDRDLLARNHRQALAESHIVASVARRLHDDLVTQRADALYLPNGVEVDRFASPAAAPGDEQLEALLESGRPIAGYYGALAEWFDYGLLLDVARRRPDWGFLLIGPMYDDSLRGHPVLQSPNVTWLGPRPYESLPGYLAAFTTAMIPFVINDITVATSPLKLYEFFAAGKPVISTPMPECAAFPEVHVVSDAADFDRALDAARAAGADPSTRERLRGLGRQHSWTRRVETVVERVASLGFKAPRDHEAEALDPAGPASAE